MCHDEEKDHSECTDTLYRLNICQVLLYPYRFIAFAPAWYMDIAGIVRNERENIDKFNQCRYI